ncbi:MAG: hypothetical protein WA080_09835 [Sulfuricurvum sp.]|jgi:hypothetical protein
MEIFWKMLPFLTPIVIMASMYYRHKNQDKIEKPSWLEQKPWYQSMKLKYREANIIWNMLFFFSVLIGGASFVANLQGFIYPPLPLEKMQTQQGIIKSIVKRQKMDDLLVLKTTDSLQKEYAYRLYGSADKYVDQNVTVYYSRGFSSAFSIDNQIHHIVTNDTHRILDPIPYDYERSLRINREFWNLPKYCFYILLFSAFMIWAPD